MKTIGLIGGLSWHSTVKYYCIINQIVNQRLGGSHSAKLLIYSADLDDFKIFQEKGDWNSIELMLTEIALKLQNSGADCITIASNTPHIVAEKVIDKLSIPLLHIADETAKEIQNQGIGRVGLLGTGFTMENPFFAERLSKYGIKTLLPEPDDRAFIHKSIFDELTRGIVNHQTRIKYLEVIERLRRNGVEGIILGCTELSLLINQNDVDLKIFDTTAIHARAAAEFALS